MRPLYTVATWLLTPFLLAYLYWRSLSNPGYRRRLGERFGDTGFRSERPGIWIHAASMGEVAAAAALVRRLLADYPEHPLIVTTMTPTGSDRVRELFGNEVSHCYVPWELTGASRRFLEAANPVIGVIMETEIWPILYRACREHGVPLTIANARLSSGSVRAYRRLGGLIRETLAGVDIAAQGEADAERFVALGAEPERVRVTGNLKFDFDIPAAVAARGAEFRRTHGGGRPVWIAGSTHDEEELAMLAVHRMVRAALPDALLLLVPRHPERFAAVGALLEREGMSFVARSSGLTVEANTSVLLGDSMGELTMLYAAADVTFVGGSLVPVGGHNLLEPAALGLPVLTGPHNFNSGETADLLVEAGAAQVVMDTEALAQYVTALLGDADRRASMGNAGRGVVERNRGALERLVALVDARLKAARSG